MNITRHIMVGAIALGSVALTNFDLRADLADDIRLYIEDGEYDTALQMAKMAVQDSENARIMGRLYQVLGEAQYYSPGTRRESYLAFSEAKERGVAEANLYLGRLAMLDFNFTEAQKLFGTYATLQRKAKLPLDDDFEYDQADASEGKRQFDRMQEIVVIDEVRVPRKEFFKHLRLPLSAGRVVASSELPLDDKSRERSQTAFISESGDLMLWSEVNDSTGMLQLMEATRLIDGSLSDPQFAPEFLGQEGDVINPFLSADGTTLYFGANGDNTVGGYDIFIATRDPQTGEYLQPVNAGIPFNSSADEYIMAIDEENGVGWWATDRHYLPDGMITLYVYILPEERKNLVASDDEKRLRARLDDIKATWTPPVQDEDSDSDSEDDEDDEQESEVEEVDPSKLAKQYSDLAAEIRKIQPGQKPRRHDCIIPLGKGRYIYSVDDVKTADEKRLVEEYIAAEKKYQKDCKHLSELRRDYARQTSRAASGEIANLEESVSLQRRELTSILSRLYQMLKIN